MVTENELRAMIVNYGNDRDLARNTGLHFNSIYRFKAGRGSISLRHAEAVYKFLMSVNNFAGKGQ